MIADDAYEIDVQGDMIHAKASKLSGLHHAAASIFQMVHAQDCTVPAQCSTDVPLCSIKDAPRFGYRVTRVFKGLVHVGVVEADACGRCRG